jgi:hypothetical protein
MRHVPSDLRATVEALRRVIHRVTPGSVETALWDGLSYHRPEVGGRVKGATCFISWKKGCVRLEFIHGARLSDPARLLRGAAVSKRHVAIASPADARRPAIARLIRDAAAITW